LYGPILLESFMEPRMDAWHNTRIGQIKQNPNQIKII
jgi:hypothetical protein